MNPRVIDFDHGISAIDSGYVRGGLDAIHLIVENGRAAIVDTGTTNSVPHVLKALKQKGLAEADFDERSRSFFTGDIFGISYRELDVDGMEFVFPTTSPVQFDPVAAHASIDRLMGYRPVFAYLTHYSRITHLARHAATLHEFIDEHVTLAERAHAAGENRHGILREQLVAAFIRRVRNHGGKLSDNEVRTVLEMDIELNAQGLEVWLDSRASSSG